MMLRRSCCLFVATCVLAALAGGCGGGKTMRIQDEDQFKEVVLGSDKPVLVDFYKGGCATCAPLDGVMDQLSEEYEGRAVIAKFETMTSYFKVRSPELKERYDISFYPTVILFVNGEVKKRWVMRYSHESYQMELDKYAAPAPALAAE